MRGFLGLIDMSGVPGANGLSWKGRVGYCGVCYDLRIALPMFLLTNVSRHQLAAAMMAALAYFGFDSMELSDRVVIKHGGTA